MNKNFIWLGLLALILIVMTFNYTAKETLFKTQQHYSTLEKNAHTLSSLQEEWHNKSAFKRALKKLESFGSAKIKKRDNSVTLRYLSISSGTFDQIMRYLYNHPIKINRCEATKVDNNTLLLEVEIAK